MCAQLVWECFLCSCCVHPMSYFFVLSATAQWWLFLLVTPNFSQTLSCHDPVDHQLIHSARGPIQKSRCLLRLWLTFETNPPYSLTFNYYIRSPGLCFEPSENVFVFVWEIMGVRSAKKNEKRIHGIENRATTMHSQCFLRLLSLTNTTRCNLTLHLF